jgi:hypothetical protein
MAGGRNHARPVVRIPPPSNGRPTSVDWPAWIERIERKRRAVHRTHNGKSPRIAENFYINATVSSFRLEGIDCSVHEAHDAVQQGAAQRKFRSRAAQRIRNHVAILYSIESTLRHSWPLKSAAVLRWYTSISSGLSTNELGIEKMMRLEQIVRRIDSPQLRLQPAIQEIARTHAELLSDHLFPSFNGILARLLLRYHLGRCGLPSILFDEAIPLSSLAIEQSLTLCLLGGIDESYDKLLT